MKSFIVDKSFLDGALTIPPSKSQTLRAILFGALGQGKTLIRHFLQSPDAFAMIRAVQAFGASVEIVDQTIQIIGTNGSPRMMTEHLDVGNSGLVLRLGTAVAALDSKPLRVFGDCSIQNQRSVKQLLSGLCQLGASGLYHQELGFAPFTIQGCLKGGQAVISGEDSQPVSALLIASAYACHPTNILVDFPGEKPWIDMTLNWFDRLGIPYSNQNYQNYHIKGNYRHEGFSYSVPGDLSSVAFPLAAGLITQSEITINNVDLADCQGDKKLIEIFQQMGALIDYDPDDRSLHLKKGAALGGVTVDLNDCIDGLPIMAVVACYAEGKTHITNASIARQKECNRIFCIVSELRKMGAHIEETEDGLIVWGSPLKGACVDSHHDHRMAMALTVAGMGAKGKTVVNSVECVEKTFPHFLESFQRLGCNLSSC